MKQSVHYLIFIWNSLCFSARVLIVIATLALFQTIITVFCTQHPVSPSDVAVRSVMSSIFGFLLGTQTTDSTNLENKEALTLIATFTALLCLLVSIAMHWFPVDQTGAAAVEIRNLMFAAVGFLLSKVKNQNSR